jgi:hypothetical protein
MENSQGRSPDKRALDETAPDEALEERQRETWQRDALPPREPGMTAARDHQLEDDFEQRRPAFERHYDESYLDSGYTFNQVLPAYRFGFRVGSDQSHLYWDEVEPNAREHWEQYDPGTWFDFREAIQFGWALASGRYRVGMS